MTVEEMRAIMRRRVVPEDLVVQNIVEYLMDESAQLPKLSAFAFLNRIHDLGMSAKDFTVLLEGCGAPQSAVEKIKANPAMSLNNLVLTLENSGLTSDDYSEMLYTARMVFEQTQTTADALERAASENSEEDEERTVSELFDDIPEETGKATEEDTEESVSEEKTSVGGTMPEDNKYDTETELSEKETEADEDADVAEEHVPENKAEENADILDDTSTLIISIDPKKLKKGSAERSLNPESLFDDDADERSEDDEKDKSGVSDEEIDEKANDEAEDTESPSEGHEKLDETKDDESDHDSKKGGYNKPALIISAVGACVLLLLCAYFTFFGKTDPFVKKIGYAEDNDAIFAEVYDSYNAGNMGGEKAQSYFAGEKLFGNILVSQSDLGIVSDGDFVYICSEKKLEAYDDKDISSAAKAEILPPENTEFVDLFQNGDSVIAVFSGKECGFMNIKKGYVNFTVHQDGELCDFSATENEISFGSVYVPHYTHTFNSSDVNEYIPRVGKDEKTALSAGNILLGEASGCSYAVWGKYSLADGSTLAARAALGDPVYAGASGMCAMNFTDKSGAALGKIVSLSEEPVVKETEAIFAAAECADMFAALGNQNIKLFDAQLEEKSILNNLPALPDKMKFSGKVLLLGKEDGVFSAISCANIDAPTVLETTKENGVVFGDSAVTFKTDSQIEASLLHLENGEVKQTGSFSKSLSESELSTLEIGGAETAAFGEGVCAFAFKYFDGVSIVSQCIMFGKDNSERTLYDDRTGYTAVFSFDGSIYAVSSKGLETVFE